MKTDSATVANTINGGSAADTITGGAAADTINGGAGADNISGNVRGTSEVQSIAYAAVTGIAGNATDTVTTTITTPVGAVTITSGQLAATKTDVELGAIMLAAAIADATLAAEGYTFAAGATADILVITAPSSDGDIGNTTISGGGGLTGGAGTLTQGATGVAVLNTTTDTLTGGSGGDTFTVNVGGAVTVADSITDLDLNAADVIVFDGIGSNTTEAVVTLTSGQQTTVTATATLAAATAAVLGTAGTDGNVAQFTYGADTYIVVNGDGNGTYDAADLLIKVTGVSGTLDVSDFTFA